MEWGAASVQFVLGCTAEIQRLLADSVYYRTICGKEVISLDVRVHKLAKYDKEMLHLREREQELRALNESIVVRVAGKKLAGFCPAFFTAFPKHSPLDYNFGTRDNFKRKRKKKKRQDVDICLASITTRSA